MMDAVGDRVAALTQKQSVNHMDKTKIVAVSTSANMKLWYLVVNPCGELGDAGGKSTELRRMQRSTEQQDLRSRY
jgi:hypothetical protein